jgi:hypothetical protein
MTEVSPFRLYLLRGVYLLIAVAQGLNTWPGIFQRDRVWGLEEGLIMGMMGALTALSWLGLRYPLQMLPLLLWEIVFKTLWLIVVALPAWLNGRFDAAMATTTFACGLVVIVYVVVPWDYVVSNYVIRRGDPWRKAAQSGQHP